MATIPSQEQINILKTESAEAIKKKIKSQNAKGKDFIVDKDGHHAGVIPESVWQNLPGKKVKN